MAFITKSNASRIIKEINIDVNLEGKIYTKDIIAFSRKDINKLLALEQLYSNPDAFLEKKYQKIANSDTLSYVFEGGQPAYHCKNDCVKLVSSFVNYKVPDKIKSKGTEEVLRFRTWFNQNKNLLEKPDVFAMRLKSAFGIDWKGEQVDHINSGTQKIENLNLEDLEAKIDSILLEMQRYYDNSDTKKQFVLKNFIKSTSLAYTNKSFSNNNSGYTEKALKDFLKKYDETFKKPLKKLLHEYYRVKSNPLLSFEGNILEQLGFRKCRECHTDKALSY